MRLARTTVRIFDIHYRSCSPGFLHLPDGILLGAHHDGGVTGAPARL
jgi:hypothetical protein